MPFGIDLPREPKRDEVIDAEWGRKIVRCLRTLTLSSSKTVRVNRTPGGTTLEAVPGTPPPDSIPHLPVPFRVIDASDEEGAKVRVSFGQVNFVTPTIGGVALGTDPAPTLDVVDGVVLLKVEVDADTGVIVSGGATIESAAEKPDPTNTEGYAILAEVDVEDDAVTAIRQGPTHSLQVRRCGVNDYHFWGL